MQLNESKQLLLSKKLGKLFRRLRINNTNLSINKLAESYDIARGNLSKIENGIVECKFVTVWKIAEALNMKCSDVVRILEEELGEDFKLMDE